MKRTKIAVVGCGAAGAAVAVFLKRAGYEVVVYEQEAGVPCGGRRFFDAA